MKDISFQEAQALSSPNPFGLVVSADANGNPNLMAISWWTYASNKPPALIICVSSHCYTGELIEEGGEFTLCLVDEALSESAFACGTCSGRTVNKPEKFAIPLEPSAKVATPYVSDSRIAFECKVVKRVQAGDHIVFIAEVAAVHADGSKKHLYSLEGYGKLDTV